jgi:superfamily II DNA or RNA helicase
LATRIRLRPWQADALAKLRAHESPDFLAVATPGAGKTTFALAAAVEFLRHHRAARLIIVAPTQHLKVQWAQAAGGFGLHLDPDWSARDGSLPSDMHGIVTTYQQVSTSYKVLAGLAKGSMVVFDEIHHAGDDRAWGSAVLEAFGLAERRLALSGTPFRSDTSAIPFVRYHLEEAVADFEYGYGDALLDRRVVRPVFFPRINGFMEWIAPDGESYAATFADELDRERANQRLRTALSLDGDWLAEVLAQANEQLTKLRAAHPEAAGLVIAMDQAHAQGIADMLRARHGVRAVVAVSDDPLASDKIAQFADSTDPWIVAVRMVSEGVDIPRLRVGVFATTTTTELFFRQAVGRLVRWTRGVPQQRAFFLIPDDPRLATFASRIAEQRRHSLAKATREQEEDRGELAEPTVEGAEDTEQMSLFAVVGSVALDSEVSSPSIFDAAYHDHDLDAWESDSHAAWDHGEELDLQAPPPPGWTEDSELGWRRPGETLKQTKTRLREANADAARELARATNLAHAHINRELNRLAGVDRVTEATSDQLRRRLQAANRWLRSLK